AQTSQKNAHLAVPTGSVGKRTLSTVSITGPTQPAQIQRNDPETRPLTLLRPFFNLNRSIARAGAIRRRGWGVSVGTQVTGFQSRRSQGVSPISSTKF
ncbi:hypothetical protein AAMO2058_000826100, partial [Amorphochlora amoebiformis]